jgi:nucleoside-diphosphate-sugar epimerase
MILVTGGTGLTGQFVVEELVRRGRKVRVLSRAQVDVPPGVELARGDLADLESLAQAVRGVDGIVHAACTFTDASIDTAAMATLVEHWPSGPFVYISSLDVYGFAGSGPITEATPLDGALGDYARGKVACEQLLARAGRTDYVTLRAPYIWGPHPKPRERLLRLIDRDPVVLPGIDPAEWAEFQDAWIDARDLAHVIAEALEHPVGRAFNVLHSHFRWHDLAAQLIRLTGRTTQIVHKRLDEISESELPRRDIYAQRWRFSADLVTQQLGEFRTRGFDLCVRETILGRP